MRMYQEIWETLKKNKHCKISSHPAKFPRIKRMVSKEKDQDLVWKLESPNGNWVLKFTPQIKEQELHIILVKSLELEDL